ncbi:hypothetical protein ACPZMI_01200 [Pseudomonas wayambapalatensis]|uniref:hypothetical protein n=1 Tax=Pseudomonas wayambapalatensis TaxID=485895 RepID=UPI003CE98A18
MARSVEIILGYVDTPVGAGAAASSLIDQYNSDKKGFSLVNQSAQTGAAVASVTSIVRLTAGFTPFLNIKTNTLAATTVLLKITAEYRQDQKFDSGDVLSLVGNVAGVVGSVALLAGSGPVAVVLTGVGVFTNVAGVVGSDAAKNLYDSLLSPVLEKYFVADPGVAYPDYWVAPDLTLASLGQISAAYSGRIAVSNWDPDTQVVLLGSDHSHTYGVMGGSGGSGYVENGAGPGQVVEPSGNSIGVGPLIFPVPESPGWSIDIGPFEIIQPGMGLGGGDKYH